VYRCFGAPNRIGVEHSLVIRTTECAALGARVAHGSNCEIARGTLLALGPLSSCRPLRSRRPPRTCRAFLPFTAGEANRQQDNQGNRRCFHTRAPRPQGRPGGRIATLECVADAFAVVWRPSSFTRYINGRTASRKESSRPPWGGLAIICGNEVKCRPDRVRGKAFFEGKGPSENVIRALFKKNSRLSDTLPDANPASPI